MKISENKQPNKYVALVTYCIALICLLAGLFVPLFGGKILALQFGGIIDGIAGTSLSSEPYALAGAGLITIGGFKLDFTALAILLYTAVTALGIIFLIPIGVSVKKGTHTSFVLEYVIEVLAVIFLALCLIPALQFGELLSGEKFYNLMIAIGGTFVMLVILSFVTKGAQAAVKLILAILGIFVYISVFHLTALVPSLTLTGSVTGGFVEQTASVNVLTVLFNDPSLLLSGAQSVAEKTVICLCIVAGLLAIINFCTDTAALAVNKKRSSLIFNIVRYALSSACAIAAIITVLAGSFTMGVMLILFAGASVLQLVISTARYCITTKSAKIDDLLNSLDDDNSYRFEKRTDHREQFKAEPVRAELMDKNVTDIPDNGPVQVTIMDIEEISPSSPVTEETRPVQSEPVQEIKPVQPVQPEPVQEVKPVQPVQPEPVQEVKPVQPVQPEPVQEVRPVQPVQPEPVQEIKPVQPVQPEPVQEVRPVQPVQPEPVQEVRPVQPVQPEPVQPATQIYTINTIYGGPVDDFMRKLTNDEKIEFARTFIERVNGNIGNIPEYVIGGNNRAFFSSVFIYLGRVRGLISDNLLNKMYKELNIL